MPGNSATVSIAIEVDDKGSVKIRQLGEAARKAGDEGARGFEAMGKSATGAERGINTMSTSLKALGGLAAAVAASAIVQQIAQIGGAAIKAASDMEETQGKFDVVFQGMTAQAEAWAGELRANFAMSSLEAKRFMGDIQNMLVPAGLMREEAGKMSFELTKLAADLGSFNNMPTEQVFRDIMSALQGSTETMDKYGINVRQTLVEQKALNMGLAATAKELTHADRLTATYALIVEQAGDAIGDTARTSESFANQQKQLNANLEEVRITIGQALLPTVNDMVSGMNDWFRENEAVLKQDLATWAGAAAGAINLLAGAAHAGAVAIGAIDDALGKLGISYSSMADKWNAYSNSFKVVWEQATGVRDTKTGSFIDQQAVKIDGLQTKLARLQQQAAATGESFSTGFEVGLGDSTAASSALTAEITETQAALDAARSASALFQDGIKTVGVDVNDLSSFTDELTLSTDGATTSTTKLGQAATDTAKALDTKSASTRTAAKSAEDMAREDERVGRQMLADHAARVKATQELTDNLNEHARKGAEEKRKALADQLRLEYADEAAAVDEKMRLEREHADWVRSLQTGLRRDIEAGIGDFVYDFLTGEFDSINDLFDNLCKSILRAFANLIAEMVAKWAMSGLKGLFTGQGFGGFNMAAMGLGPGGILGGGTGAAGSWLGAAGYQPGAGSGWTSYAGPALATAGGAYALYDAANKASKGEMNAGTAIEAAGGAYLAYTGGSALWSKLGGAAAAPIIQDMVVPASSEIMIAASDLTLLGPQTGGIGNAIAGGGAGAAVGPMAATAGALALWGGIAYGINKLGSTPTQQAVEWDQLNNYGTWGRDRGSFRSDQRPGWEMSGSGDAAMQSWGTIDSTASKYGFEVLEGEILSFVEAAKQSLADLTSTMGQEWADLAAGLENSVPAYDAYLDAIMGVDVAMEQSAEIHRLAQQAAADNGASLVHLTNALKAMGMSDEMARASAVALVAAVDQQQAASVSAASAAQSMAAAVADFSSTPLNIRVKVNVDTNMGGDSYMAPRHASGGIFASPTLIPSINGRRHLVGEAGAEAITPLHAGPDTLKKMDAKLDALLSGGRPVQHVINLDGRQIATATLPYVDAHVAAKAGRGALSKRTVF